MTAISSPLSISNVVGLPLLSPSSIPLITGLPKVRTRADFDADVTQERTLITNNGLGIWIAGEQFMIIGEAGTRRWVIGVNGPSSHARTVSYMGSIYTLAADANVFGVTTGAPGSGTGANGDYMADGAAGLVYGPKAGGVWPAGVPTITVAQITALGPLLPTSAPSAFGPWLNGGVLTFSAASAGGASDIGFAIGIPSIH